jgi:hypothetical protein
VLRLGYVFCLIVLIACSKKVLVGKQEVKVLKFEAFTNVLIHESSSRNAPCEPTICIDPNNTNFIIAGSVLDNVYVSKNGGINWEKSKLKSTHGVYGDPVIRIGNNSEIYYSHLSNPSNKAYSGDDFLDRIVVQTSHDQGSNWTDGTNPECDHNKDHDKQWLSIDPMNNNVLMSWTEFDKYGSKIEKDKSRILFSSSSDGAKTWTDAIVISEFEGDCLDDDKTTEGAHPAVGIDGTYYVVWGYDSKLYLDKSSDQGKTWLDKDIVIADQPMGWSFDVPGIGRCNGLPVMDVDHSNGEYRGNLYISWSDQRNGTNDTDVWIIKSADNGKSWSNPKRVNDDAAGKHQFFSWMDIDPTTGYLYFVFYDRRAYDNNLTDVYMAYSTDGGVSFVNQKISEKPFLPESYVFFGDYIDISVMNGKIRPIWTAQDKSKLSIYTAIINLIK